MPKMKRATIVKFSLDELAGVDAGAQAEAGTVVLKRKDQREPATATTKRSAITSAILGHTHLVTGIDDMQSGCTSSERTSEAGVHYDSYSSYHSHPWVRTEDGSIALGEAAGHTHDIATSAASLVATTAVKSTRTAEPQKVTPMTKTIVVLSEAQGAHYAKLSGTDAETFVAKSALEREAEVMKAREADPIVFTGEATKMEVRRSDGPRFLELAKQNEANAVASKRSLEMAETEKAAREWSEVVKRASGIMGHLAGSDDDHGRLLQSIERETDATKRDAMIATLKAADSLMVAAGKAKGVNPGTDPEAGTGNGLTEWDAAVTTYAEKAGIKDHGVATDKFLGTPEGRVAKRAYDKASAEYRRQHEHDGDDA